MYQEKKILAVIPARSGSKGVKHKNIRQVGGIPIVCRAGLCAKEISEIDRVVVSTDGEKIAKVAKAYDIDVPFLRPKSISKDTSTDFEVLEHALREMEKNDDTRYDIVLLLQPTAPLRKPAHLLGVIKFLIKGNFDAVWTVSKTEMKYHPMKQMLIKDKLISFVIKDGEKIPRRQELEQTYHINGIAYALTRECIFKQKNRLGKRTGGYIIGGASVSIDTEADFKLVEKILETK